MRAFFRDLRYAARGLARARGFSAIALTTLALGIGSNTAVFSVVRGVLLAPLPYGEPDRLVKVGGYVPGIGTSELAGSPAELYDYRERASSFEDVTGVWPLHTNLVGGSVPVRISTALVHPNFFDVLDVNPALGRVFRAEEMRLGVGTAMILSWDVFQRQFGGDDSVVGRSINIDGDPVEVVGVMPDGFHHPGQPLGADIEAWTTMDFEPGGRWFFRNNRPLQLFARLADGVSMEASRDEMSRIGEELRGEYPESYPSGAGWLTGVEPLQDEVVGDMRRILLILAGAVGFVLIIACANVSALMIARGAARDRQTAVRLALGSSRWQIARFNLAEGLLLSLAGGAVAGLLAIATTGALQRFAGAYLPRAELITVDLEVVGFALVVAVGTSLLFGMAPAMLASMTSPRELLSGGGRGSTRTGSLLRDGLVVGEVAVSVVLVVASGLMLSSFRNLMSVDTGFDAENVHVVQTYLPVQIDPNEGRWRSFPNRVGFYDEVIRLLEDEPSVTAAAGVSHLPLRESNGARFGIEGEALEGVARPTAEYRVASEKYFEVMGIPVVSGRSFTSLDHTDSELVVLVSRSWVGQYAEGRDPLQMRIQLGGGPQGAMRRIVGVVDDVRLRSLDVEGRPTIYSPYRQTAGNNMTFVIKSAGASAGLLDAARTIIERVDADQPAFGMAEMNDVVAASVSERSVLVWMVSVFGVLALLLAGLGIFGVVSFTVSQRMREIGIRLTLGARPSSVAGLVLRDGMVLGGVGLIVGLLGAAATTGVLRSMLFGVHRFEPAVLLGVGVTTLVVVAGGCLIPARRAAGADPMRIIHAEEQ